MNELKTKEDFLLAIHRGYNLESILKMLGLKKTKFQQLLNKDSVFKALIFERFPHLKERK